MEFNIKNESGKTYKVHGFLNDIYLLEDEYNKFFIAKGVTFNNQNLCIWMSGDYSPKGLQEAKTLFLDLVNK